MKKLALTVSILILTTITYGQFAPIGAEWFYSASGNGSAPTGAEYYHYQSQLDTIVAGQSCQKISVTYYRYNGMITNQPPIFTYQKGDTVYYYNKVYSKYFPLYIFNVSQGDTLTFHSPVVPFTPADTVWHSIVDSVTNFIVNGDTLKRVWTTELSTNAFSFWGGYIELLGSPFLMLHQPRSILMEWDGPMRCYSDSKHFFNFNNFACDYRLISRIDEYEHPFGLLVFPNPATDQLNIQTSNKQKFKFNIYNSLGQIVQTGILERNTTTIQIDKLTNGIYSIELSADSKTERRRFIVKKQSHL